MLERKIVFIADRVSNHANATIESRDLEMLADVYFEQVQIALNKIAPRITYYASPMAFLEHISEHKSDIVISLWSGSHSRNRRALIPSICEAYKIAYVGADPYIQTISADKHLSKFLCAQYEIPTARDIVISSKYDLPLIKSLHFPVVVKPNFEGGSIGIFNENLADDYNTATIVCKKLLPTFTQLIVEEYIAGEEISVCIAGAPNSIDVFQVIRTSVNNKSYFDHDILGAEAKKMGQAIRTRDIITDHFPLPEKTKLITFYKSLGKVDAIRIDGRLDHGKFTVIELTPDCSLSKTGSMSRAFMAEGYSYEEMFEILCRNVVRNQELECQNANKL